MSFPLYTMIINSLKGTKDLTVIQKSELMEDIKTYTDAHESIYGLIKCYYQENDKGNPLGIPYSGVLSDRGRVEFNLMEFPVKLRKMIYKFMEIHKKRAKEDREMQDAISVSESVAEV